MIMTKSTSKAEDARRAEASQGRVEKIHGGKLVESVAAEELELMNDPECKHEKLIRDPSETEFNAFICANPNCGTIVIFDKE